MNDCAQHAGTTRDELALLLSALQLGPLQYNGGYTPYSTVLQAQQSLFPQELTLAQTRASVYNSLVTLYKATGGGWVEIAEKTSVQPPDMKVPAPPVAQAQNATAAAVSKQDRIEVQQQGDMSIVNVYRVGGIGGAQVKAPKSGWPPAVGSGRHVDRIIYLRHRGCNRHQE